MTSGRFRTPRREPAPETPEALWYSLASRRQHQSLRGPQQDVLRGFVESKQPDVVLELPTGSGKTAAGLLIAEWHRRRSGSRVVYLTLTRQLAYQAIAEARKVGLEPANLIGSREERLPAEVGRYRNAQAIGISTYSNLFNANPVAAGADLIVFDDAHGGGETVAEMWTTRIDATGTSAATYRELVTALAPAMTNRQRRQLETMTTSTAPHLVHLAGRQDVMTAVDRILSASDEPSARYNWPRLRESADALLVLVSRGRVSFRPLIPPTHAYPPFKDASRRVYLSATAGSPDDLARAYGIGRPGVIRAPHARSGRHYIVVPENYASDEAATQALARVWKSVPGRRALLLTPSDAYSRVVVERLAKSMFPPPTRFQSAQVEESLDAFTTSENSVLTLTRYDGVDLPGDDCRLLLLAGSPDAVGDLEALLKVRWAAGPVLRSRQTTRFLQGLGRCTRGDTDYSLVFLLGQNLGDLATHQASMLPAEVRAELKWGLAQSEVCGDDPAGFADLLGLLMTDSDAREEANEQIDTLLADDDSAPRVLALPDGVVSLELRYAALAWAGDWVQAAAAAREVADAIGGTQFSGYRAWWHYLAGAAAVRTNDRAGARDALLRSVGCNVNTEFVGSVLSALAPSPPPQTPANVEGMWAFLADEIGWSGLGFKKFETNLTTWCQATEHTAFHMGLELLGRALGLDERRPTGPGEPDGVWSVGEARHIAFEAKTEKQVDARISKRDVQEANGHARWVRSSIPGAQDSEVHCVIIAPNRELDGLAEPHVEDLRFATPTFVATLASEVVAFHARARQKFVGRELADSVLEFAAEVQAAGLAVDQVVLRLTADAPVPQQR